MMIRNVIQYQHQRLMWVDFEAQPLQEIQKAGAGLALDRQGVNCCTRPVQRTNEVDEVTVAGMSRQPRLLTAFHPAAPQRIVQAQGCFVHKEEATSPVLGCFFNSSNHCWICWRTAGSCL